MIFLMEEKSEKDRHRGDLLWHGQSACNWDTGSWMGGETPGSGYMIHNVTTNAVQDDVAGPLTEGPECRTAMIVLIVLLLSFILESFLQGGGMLTEGCGFSCVSCRQGESTVSVLVVFVISSSDFRTWTFVCQE